jgi:hypothetical protein
MTDTIENFHGVRIHHGPQNNRIYLLQPKNAVPQEIAVKLLEKARQHSYSKILVKVPRKAGPAFIQQGFEVEAEVLNFYSGAEDALFLGYYLSP